jgi:hypothetical protein
MNERIDYIIERLKSLNAIIGFKIEFEAEGASVEDLVYLKLLSIKYSIPLYLKIGGVEALNDIKIARLYEIDGIIAPMVESAFGAHKFIEAIAKSFNGINLPLLTLTIETKNGFNELDDIFEIAKNKIDFITFGRTDFSGSFFDKNVYPDSDFTTEKLVDIVNRVENLGFKIRVGGSIKNSTREVFTNLKQSLSRLHSVETRKVVMDFEKFIANEEVLNLALEFEKELLRIRKSLNDIRISEDLYRLNNLEGRK